MLMFGKISTGVRSSITGLIRMSTSASTMNVYGRDNASLTIHMFASLRIRMLGDSQTPAASAQGLPLVRPVRFPGRQPDLSPAREPCIQRVAAGARQRKRAREDEHEREQEEPRHHLAPGQVYMMDAVPSGTGG